MTASNGEPKHEPSLDSDPLLEEVRVAMALNGGVSLAVWMGGCAVELDCARRAYAGVETVPVPDRPSDTRLDRVLAMASGDRPPAAAPEGDVPGRRVYFALCKAFRRRLVIDLMSGASAGGINGALLAAASTHGTRLHPDLIRNRWVKLGDFAELLHPMSVAKPTSLMQGQRFYNGLLEVFERLTDVQRRDKLVTAQPAVRPQDGVKLDVTTTDVVGEPREFRDSWGGVLRANEYRARFRFRVPEDYQPQLLAQAARASASFPVAFEPWHASCEAAALANFKEPRWMVDGGVLDNAPIRAALDLIPSQPALREVQRFVCYVNADPAGSTAQTIGLAGPELPQILGYVAALPRKAPFVDQLTAVERATRRSGITDSQELMQLVMLDGASLESIAADLLPVYRRRRRLLSLEDLLESPAAAASAFQNLAGPSTPPGGEPAELPWIPDAFPSLVGGWRWGVRAAQRVLHLQLDLLRAVTARRPLSDRASLFKARVQIGRQLELLEQERANLKGNDLIRGSLERLAGPTPDIEAEIALLTEAIAGCAAAVGARIADATAALYGCRLALAELGGDQLVERLFGPDWESAAKLDERALDLFLVRALGIEVVRRAFFDEEDIDSAQRLRFVQLTPNTPSPVFASPQRPNGWTTPEEKLTGIELGHFSAFYRRSWRVNDFMWGRLDAAARIVEMLVDPIRAVELDEFGDGKPPWDVLAEQLVPDDADDGLRWQLQMSLGGGDAIPPAVELREQLRERLQEDLGSPAGGGFTRLVCTRATQFEILQQELPILVEESRTDEQLGSGSGALSLPASGPEAIKSLCEEPALPLRLGRDQGEIASNLALRTMTHAALDALAMSRGAKVPLGNIVYGIRAALLPIAGLVARSPVYRLGTAVGFWAAVLLIAARTITLDPKASAEIELLWSADTIAAVIAGLVIGGVAAVPIVRWRRSVGRQSRSIQAFAAAALLIAGGVATIWMALKYGDADLAHVIGAPKSDHPPDWALGLAIALLAGPVAARFIPFVPDVLEPLVDRPWAGKAAFFALSIPVGCIVGSSASTVYPALDDGDWRAVAAVLAGVVAPLSILAYVVAPQRLRSRAAAMRRP